MNEKMIISIEHLNWMPKTKELLKNFILHQYEEAADLSDYSLVQEYNNLLTTDRLHFMFESEYIFNTDRLNEENN